MHVNRGFRILDPDLKYEKGDLFHIFDGILTAESKTPDKEYSNIYYLSDNHDSFYSEYEANKYAIDHFRKLYADRGIEIDVEKVKAKVVGEKQTIFEDVWIKEDESFTLELHLDTDDGNGAMAKTGDMIEIYK